MVGANVRDQDSLRSELEEHRRRIKARRQVNKEENFESNLQWVSFRQSMLRIGIVVRSSLRMWLHNLELGVQRGNVAVHDFMFFSFFSAFWHSKAHATRPVTTENS